MNPYCPHCKDEAPHGDARLVWISAHLENTVHKWYWALKKRLAEGSPHRVDGVWVAFYWTFSDFVMFDDELQAMQYADENYAEVRFVPFGEDVHSYLRRSY